MKNKIIIGVSVLALVGVIALIAVNNSNTDRPKKNNTVETTNVSEPTTLGYVEITTSADAEEILIGLSDVDLSDDIKTKVQDIFVKVNEYYVKNHSKKQLISAYGMLYSAEKNAAVTASDLKAEGFFDGDDEIINNIDILLMKPKDVAEYSENVDSSSDELDIFVVFNSNVGYYVVNDDYEPFVLEKADYENMVMSYSYINGKIRNPKRGDDDYNAIMQVINFNGNYDVKHIACDDKYAVVVVGSLDDTKIIKEYLLENNDGWQVVASDLEKIDNVKVYVNSLYPKMEVGIMPKYEIENYGELKNGFDGYLNALVQLGMITESDLPATYTCGVDKFVYVECGGKKLLGCTNDENKLEFFEVKDLTEAIKLMLAYNQDPPVFILNFEN